MTEPIDLIAPFKDKQLIGFHDYNNLLLLAEELQSDLNTANAELDELNAWKAGKRGVEDFYIIRENLEKTKLNNTALRAELLKLQNHNVMIVEANKRLAESLKLQADLIRNHENDTLRLLATHKP